MTELNWADAVRQAREGTGYAGEDIPRTVEGIRERVQADRWDEFDRELGTLGGGRAFEAFLNHWWTQALADTAPGTEAREIAIEFADLAVALYVRTEGGPTYSSDEIERMITGKAS
ncbi:MULTISPECIES: hypothetical protein [Streptomyces]|uniref:hypothetical protein n=1 Tax=Streptomyces TaxID=1883 RepID=UPI00057E4181|nr:MULTISPECIES: hypothetical protein [Streptomyces]AJC57107.1 hypothetical protein GZL_04529 [Streptomyces sp. 769]QRX93350.1 hypothetical protein JNO44_23020 [Streptomyces noursei]UJB43066.1 hypothetical protein HRD51_21540 [Streptomyces sp. A1-5]